MKNTYHSDKQRLRLFNMTIMSHIELWVNEHLKNNDGEVPEVLMQMKTKGFQQRVINGFTSDDVKLLQKIEKTKEFKEMKNDPTEISYLVHALLVLKWWAEDIPKDKRPALNIAENKLKYGKAHYAKGMLVAKNQSPNIYAERKKIINDTEEKAFCWYSIMKKYILEEEHARECNINRNIGSDNNDIDKPLHKTKEA